MQHKKLPTKEGVYYDITNDDYHADRTMVTKSWLDRAAKTPLHLRQYLDTPHEKTLALILGSAVDCLVFEPAKFMDLFAKGPQISKTTKDGKVEWAEARANAETHNKTIIECHLKVNHWDNCHKMAEEIMGNPRMREIMQEGVGQAVFITQDEATGLWVKCKPDWWAESLCEITDLKTAESASAFEFARSIGNYRYHVQDAFYSDIIKKVTGKAQSFQFAVLEKPSKDAEPDGRLMAFYELPERERIAGRDTYQSDLAAIAFCYDTGEWPGYSNRTMEIERPQWSQSRDK